MEFGDLILISLHIIIPGRPQAKQRARQGKNGFYTPKKTVEAENRIGTIVKNEIVKRRFTKKLPLTGPVYLMVDFEFEMPKDWNQDKKYKMNGKPHISRPDTDNLVKTVKDALNGIVFIDDAQVYSLEVTKIYGFKSQTNILITDHIVI